MVSILGGLMQSVPHGSHRSAVFPPEVCFAMYLQNFFIGLQQQGVVGVEAAMLAPTRIAGGPGYF